MSKQKKPPPSVVSRPFKLTQQILTISEINFKKQTIVVGLRRSESHVSGFFFFMLFIYRPGLHGAHHTPAFRKTVQAIPQLQAMSYPFHTCTHTSVKHTAFCCVLFGALNWKGGGGLGAPATEGTNPTLYTKRWLTGMRLQTSKVGIEEFSAAVLDFVGRIQGGYNAFLLHFRLRKALNSLG